MDSLIVFLDYQIQQICYQWPFVASFFIILMIIFRKNRFIFLLIIPILLFLLPFFEGLKSGIIDYYKNEAKISIGYGNINELNRKYRIQNVRDIGCLPNYFVDTRALTKNSTIYFLINYFGYQKNSYTGVYPTKEESINELNKNGKIVKLKINDSNLIIEFKLDNKDYKIYSEKSFFINEDNLNKQNKISNEVLNYINLFFNDFLIKKEAKIVVKNEECIIFKGVDSHRIYLIDRNKGLAFTSFYIN